MCHNDIHSLAYIHRSIDPGPVDSYGGISSFPKKKKDQENDQEEKKTKKGSKLLTNILAILLPLAFLIIFYFLASQS